MKRTASTEISTDVTTDVVQNVTDFLKVPGDQVSARITDTGRKVLKINTDEVIYSAVKYPTGTIVETRTTRKKV